MDTNSPRFKKWDKWLDEIHEDIRKLLWYRYIKNEVFAIVRSNPAIDGSNLFFRWMLTIYGEAVSPGVRRHTDRHKDVTSLAKLLYEIYSDPKILSVDPLEVKDDLDKLDQKSRVIKDFVDKQIAHLDKKKSSTLSKLPTYKELDESLDLLEVLLKKYWNLFRAENLGSIVPVYQFDWKEIFRQPWIEPYDLTNSN